MQRTRRAVAFQDPVTYGNKLRKSAIREQKRYSKVYWKHSKEASSAAAIGDYNMAKEAKSLQEKHSILLGETKSEDRHKFNHLVDKCLSRAKHALQLLERSDLINDRHRTRNVSTKQIIIERKIVRK